jgi:hypothetical protein
MDALNSKKNEIKFRNSGNKNSQNHSIYKYATAA